MRSLGERIRGRLDELGISQSELARRVKVTQPAINDLVKGKSNSSKHLHTIARELKTTVSYLTGETDDPDSDRPDDTLTSQDREDLAMLQNLSSRDRETVRRLLLSLSGDQPTPTPAAPPSLSPPTLHSPPRKFAAGGG